MGRETLVNMLLEIRPPVGNTRGPLYTESLLRALHRANSQRRKVSLQLRGIDGGVGLAVSCPDELRVLFLQELQDAYPGVTVRPIRAETGSHLKTWSTAIRLSPDVLPLRTYGAFLDETDKRQFADPLGGLLSAIRSGHSGRISSHLELIIRPATLGRQRQAKSIHHRQARFRTASVSRWYLYWSTHPCWIGRMSARLLYWGLPARSDEPTEVSSKAAEPLFECWLVVTTRVPRNASYIGRKRLREISGALGRFHQDGASFLASKPRRWKRRLRRRGFLLSAREIATLWHPLTQAVEGVSRVQLSEFRELEAPVRLTSKEGRGETVLGQLKFRQQRNQFGIAQDDLRRHLIAIGKTGCGKSTFLLNVVRQQIEANRGVVLIDPHGQLAEEVLDVIPRRRTNEVIYFDASDRIAPVGFNPLVGPPGADPTLIADGVLTSFKNVFGLEPGTAPRLLHIFRNCLLSLIGTPHASLTGVQRLLVDTNFRMSLVSQVNNAAVQEFWLTEFNRWNDRDRTQYIASLQNKLGAFTTHDQLQRILNAGQKGIHLRQVMDGSRVLICNLSKGTVGHDASTLLGSLLLSSLQVAAMSRADIPEVARTDCTIVIDEFHSYLAEGNTTMADALAESRKYRTSYVLSTQMLDGQLDHATLTGVLGNCGSTLCMTVGPRDAETLVDLLGNGLTPEDLMRIPKYHGYIRQLIDGAPHTFSMTTLATPKLPPRRGETIRQVSRQQYGQPLRDQHIGGRHPVVTNPH
ncbi:MAG: ATP-binding protein [Planctomycetaceae bacterium]|nr:ATP-binding protein [Planctomycetaceae bacterium]